MTRPLAILLIAAVLLAGGAISASLLVVFGSRVIVPRSAGTGWVRENLLTGEYLVCGAGEEGWRYVHECHRTEPK